MAGTQDLLFDSWMRCKRRFRLRHFRGHGVHSPFAYALVRQVYMKRRRLPREGAVYTAVREQGGTVRQARLVQAVYDYTECGQCYVDGAPLATHDSHRTHRAMHIVTPGAAIGQELRPGEEDIACVLSPTAGKARYRNCLAAVRGHEGMSIDCRSVLFLFGRDGLNKEHIQL